MFGSNVWADPGFVVRGSVSRRVQWVQGRPPVGGSGGPSPPEALGVNNARPDGAFLFFSSFDSFMIRPFLFIDKQKQKLSIHELVVDF